MRFSVRVNNDLSVDDLLAVAISAESAGFDQMWVSNDMFLRSAPALVGALAARTSRIGLGIAVMNPYSVHVSELAMIAATLQEISGGRFLLGLGAGSEQFLGWAGIDRPHPLATTRSALVSLRALLGHDDIDTAQLPAWFGAGSVLRFGLSAPVPVYLGAMGPRMLEMAGRHADGALPLLYPPERYASARAQVLAGAAHASRDFDLPACFWVSVSDDPSAARTALAEKLAYYGPSISEPMLASAGLTPQDFAEAASLAHTGRAAAQLIDERMLSLGIAGDVADVLGRCEALSRLGARHLSFGPPLGPDPVAAIGLLGSQVLPVLSEFSPEPA
ncbi:MAG TPA: LLM class flavin-dependent oxidoreductase [Streptosporangiaceae bacterium]|nr:LLM class flavin-dependent oxidoreductase [Streptosporangiaceae bacterium]